MAPSRSSRSVWSEASTAAADPQGAVPRRAAAPRWGGWRRGVAWAVALLPCVAAAQAPAPPAGASEQVGQGAQLYQQHCALCHGANGRDATVFPRPIWGPGHDIGKFGTAKGLFEYLQMLMPFDDPAKLDDRQKTAVTAYMLVRNGTLPADATLPVGGNATPIR
jgi:mono/diheme cytochrome c family protein